MAFSRNRLFANYIRSWFTSDNTNNAVSVFSTITSSFASASTSTVDSISTSSATAVTFFVDAYDASGNHHFSILSATKNSSGGADYTEYGTLITNTSLATYTIDINSNEFRLRATTSTSNINFKVTRVVVPV